VTKFENCSITILGPCLHFNTDRFTAVYCFPILPMLAINWDYLSILFLRKRHKNKTCTRQTSKHCLPHTNCITFPRLFSLKSTVWYDRRI